MRFVLYMSSKQYREFARECMRWAEEANSEEDRHHFIEMAHAATEIREFSQPEAMPWPRPPRRKANVVRNGHLLT
jgi:hypothetical protein